MDLLALTEVGDGFLAGGAEEGLLFAHRRRSQLDHLHNGMGNTVVSDLTKKQKENKRQTQNNA